VLAKKITVFFIGFISPNMNLQKEDRDGTTASYYTFLSSGNRKGDVKRDRLSAPRAQRAFNASNFGAHSAKL
jgi:hypothetical protein